MEIPMQQIDRMSAKIIIVTILLSELYLNHRIGSSSNDDADDGEDAVSFVEFGDNIINKC